MPPRPQTRGLFAGSASRAGNSDAHVRTARPLILHFLGRGGAMERGLQERSLARLLLLLPLRLPCRDLPAGLPGTRIQGGNELLHLLC